MLQTNSITILTSSCLISSIYRTASPFLPSSFTFSPFNSLLTSHSTNHLLPPHIMYFVSSHTHLYIHGHTFTCYNPTIFHFTVPYAHFTLPTRREGCETTSFTIDILVDILPLFRNTAVGPSPYSLISHINISSIIISLYFTINPL